MDRIEETRFLHLRFLWSLHLKKVGLDKPKFLKVFMNVLAPILSLKFVYKRFLSYTIPTIIVKGILGREDFCKDPKLGGGF